MKKSILTTIVAACALSAFAQGTVNFVNNGSGFSSRVYGPEAGNATLSKTGNTSAQTPTGTQVYTGALLSGSGFRVQIFANAGSGQSEGSLLPATPINTFRTGSAAGIVPLVVATLQGVPKDAPSATVQWRAWDNSSGLYADWAAAFVAWTNGLIAAGVSPLLNVSAIGGDINTPSNLLGLQSFNLFFQGGIIPEPSTFALAGLGTAALFIFRRRKH
jgi:hypothetical protein